MKDSFEQSYPFFIVNGMFRGKRGGVARYYMQNVMDAQKKTRKSKFGTLEGAYSGAPALTMVSLEEYERKKYGRTFNQLAGEAVKRAKAESIAEKERALREAKARARSDKRFAEKKERNANYRARKRTEEDEYRQKIWQKREEDLSPQEVARYQTECIEVSQHWFACMSTNGQISNHVLNFTIPSTRERVISEVARATKNSAVLLKLEPVTPEQVENINLR